MSVENFIIDFKGWKSPQAWSDWFGYPPKKSGVYLFVATTRDDYIKQRILYIGSAKNIKRRFSSHEMWYIIHKDYPFFMFYWKEESDYLTVEKYLIHKYQPEYNKIYKKVKLTPAKVKD